MIFLGILLIISGIGIIIYGALLFGLMLIALGVILISKSNSDYKKEQEAQAYKDTVIREKKISDAKESWILKKTAEYIDQGMSPSDAKVKAEVDYSRK